MEILWETKEDKCLIQNLNAQRQNAGKLVKDGETKKIKASTIFRNKT